MINIICSGTVRTRQVPEEDENGFLIFTLDLQEPEIVIAFDPENQKWKLPDQTERSTFSRCNLVFRESLLTEFLNLHPLGFDYIKVLGTADTMQDNFCLTVEKIMDYRDAVLHGYKI